MWPLPYRWADFWPWSVLGVHELRLCVRQWEGDTGIHERKGHLQLRAPERTTGADRLGAQTSSAGGTFWQQSQFHQRLEGSHSARPKVGHFGQLWPHPLHDNSIVFTKPNSKIWEYSNINKEVRRDKKCDQSVDQTSCKQTPKIAKSERLTLINC